MSIHRSATRTEFWWNERRPNEQGLWDSQIELGEKFFHEIIQHPVPLDLNILKALKRSSLGLDLYLWLTYRTFTLRHPLRLSWARLYRQFGAEPARANDNRTVQDFRKGCLRELIKIKTAWPDSGLRDGPGGAGSLALQTRHPSHAPCSLWNNSQVVFPNSRIAHDCPVSPERSLFSSSAAENRRQGFPTAV